MNSVLLYLPVFAFMILALLAYFKVAVHFKIIDKPNERSSHSLPVVRGGGVIFLFAILYWFLLFGMQWPFFLIGAVAVAAVSFLDDILTLPSNIRFTVHFVSVVLVFYQLGLFDWPIMLSIAAIIVCIGALNAFNFMDGINGITGVYALVTLSTFIYVNSFLISFTDVHLLAIIVGAILIFLFFNFRKKARCFAGDVGSVTLAFLQVFLLLQLIESTGKFGWAVFFLVFGVDAVITIAFRIARKENIFKPHRTHLYQYLSNEMKLNHLVVSSAYGAIQLLINFLVIQYFQSMSLNGILFIIVYACIYLMIRIRVVKKMRLEANRIA